MNSSAWYDRLRERYRPEKVRVLLVGESPPDPRNGARRFFYDDTLSRYDNLYRSVALAAYGLTNEALQAIPKADVLRRLQSDGFWLIDAVDFPINGVTGPAKIKASKEGADGLGRRCAEADPSLDAFICASPVHAAVSKDLSRGGITVLNKVPVPFPIGNTRAEFVRLWHQYIPPLETPIAR